METPEKLSHAAFLAPIGQPQQQASAAAPAGNAPAAQAPQPPASPSTGYIPDARYTLRSGIADGRMVYIGVGGAIDGKVNPVLTATEGQSIQLTIQAV
jgi:nitrite reductase (NO-forming)